MMKASVIVSLLLPARAPARCALFAARENVGAVCLKRPAARKSVRCGIGDGHSRDGFRPSALRRPRTHAGLLYEARTREATAPFAPVHSLPFDEISSSPYANCVVEHSRLDATLAKSSRPAPRRSFHFGVPVIFRTHLLGSLSCAPAAEHAQSLRRGSIAILFITTLLPDCGLARSTLTFRRRGWSIRLACGAPAFALALT